MPIHKTVAISYGNAVVQKRRQLIPWIWDGLVAENAITVLAAPEKAGKTTLLSLLLDRRREGGLLLGKMVRPGRTILCSEEEDLLWALRQPPLDFGAQLEFHRPLGGNPTPRRWRRFIDHLLELGEDSFNLLVIDTVMHFLPAAQNNAITMRKALNELRVIAGFPAGVLLLHQTPVGRRRSTARGPLSAFADILLDLHMPRGDPFTRRRELRGVGRYPGTLGHVCAELNSEGTDYVLCEGPAETALAPAIETLRHLLSQHPTPLTRQEILARWPEPERAPRADSLWRSLARGCELGILVRSGNGTKTEAFRYGLAEERAHGPAAGCPPLQTALTAVAEVTSHAPCAPAAASEVAPTVPTGAPLPTDQAKPTEPAPAPDPVPQTTVSTAPAPDPEPPPVAEPSVPEPPVRLPWPYNLMKPADVPEEVWREARAGQGEMS